MNIIDKRDDIVMDLVFQALSSSDRRDILKMVARGDPRNRDEFLPDEVDDEELTRRVVLLEHQHFPYLDNAGFINWDSRADTVERGPNFDKLQPFLGILLNDTDRIREVLRN